MSQPPILDVSGELEQCLAVIHEAFGTVASARGWTSANAGGYTAFLELAALERLRTEGATFYGIREDGRLVACAALVRSRRPNVRHLEKLAVVPGVRHRGHGRALVDHVAAQARAESADTLGIAIVDDEPVLKAWYVAQGFRVTGTSSYPHLPFAVCFLQRPL